MSIQFILRSWNTDKFSTILPVQIFIEMTTSSLQTWRVIAHVKQGKIPVSCTPSSLVLHNRWTKKKKRVKYDILENTLQLAKTRKKKKKNFTRLNVIRLETCNSENSRSCWKWPCLEVSPWQYKSSTCIQPVCCKDLIRPL